MTSENTPTSVRALYEQGRTIKDYYDKKIERIERELAALRRGEFICQKCMLRKDGEHDTPTEF